MNPRPILNNGYAFNAGGSPFKPDTMSQGSFYTNSKNSYVPDHKKIAFSNSSDVTAKKRRTAIGKQSSRLGIPQGIPSSYASSNVNDVKHARAKARSGGYVSPPKKNMIKSFL